MATINITTGSGSASVEVATGARGPKGIPYTSSETAPDDTDYPWFDPSTGIMSVWNGNAWVVTSSGSTPGSATNIVTAATPLTGGSVTGVADVDETHYVTPAGVLATLTWNLPLAADSRVGQVKVFLSTQTITALTVTVLGSGTKVGTALTTAVANESYAYQCVSTSGTGTWLRIS